MKKFNYGVDKLTAGIALQMAAGKIKGTFSDRSLKQIMRSSKAIEDIIKNM